MRYYEFINKRTPRRKTQLSEREWEMLLALAEEKGWKRESGKYYLRKGVMGDADAAYMAAAVKEGLRRRADPACHTP